MSRVSDLRDAAKALRTKAYHLKTKKAKQRAYDAAREIEREALELLWEQLKTFGTHSVKATVRHFSPGDEHFLVNTPYGSMWVSPTADVLTKSWYSHTCCIEYAEGQEIVLEIEPEVSHEGLFISLVPGKVTGGRVNEAQYAELDKRTDLAFFKHSGCEGVTGLFASPKGGSRE